MENFNLIKTTEHHIICRPISNGIFTITTTTTTANDENAMLKKRKHGVKQAIGTETQLTSHC